MRKGYTLIELNTVVLLIGIMMIPIGRLSKVVIYDIPRACKAAETNTSMLHVLKQLKKDVNGAQTLPGSFDSYTADAQTLLIEQPQRIICYQTEQGRIVRRVFYKDKELGKEITGWRIPKGKIKWSVSRENNEGCAVGVETYIEQKSGRHIEKKFANTHLYFAHAYQEAVE